MMSNVNRARWVVGLALVGVASLAGCDRVKQELLAPQNPGLIDPSSVQNAAAALALRVGALGRYKQLVNCTNGECTWAEEGVLTDEFKNADFQVVRANVDQRNMDNSSDWNYTGLTQSRGFIRQAIATMQGNVLTKDSVSMIGELYAELGFMEMSLADMYCNGIPLGHTDLTTGAFINAVGVTDAQVYDSAQAHIDSGLALITGSDAFSTSVKQAALIFKARVLVAKGQFAAAAALVPATAVPTSYIYDMTFSGTSGGNGLWGVANSTARITVGDSFDFVNGAKNQIVNALPFASANDPRVPILSGAASSPVVSAEDQSTPMFLSQLWKGQFDPMVLASGVDARLIEAEAALNNNDIPGMMAILNALRTAAPRPVIGLTTIPAMAALPNPPDIPTATKLFFRESAFWTFGRGQRLPALRRMVRIYKFTQDQVFPTGVFFKGGSYGSDVNFQVPQSEQANPLYKGCIDRNA